MAEPPERPVSHGQQQGIDVDAVAQRLREERDEVSARLATMIKSLESLFAASVDSNADDEHDPEGQTIAYERAQLSALIRAARLQMSAIETATARVEKGTYGICDVCLEQIPGARLEARPTAQTCVLHTTTDSR
ncbi:MAG: TraR/DksA C4-type zinc finger protein [Actinomycetota bacterium]|nr:TraR/DksA C4-type zinc finger protein [Actinomycetota bacterium]